MVNIEEVRKFFEGDKYATEISGIVIEKAEKGHSLVSLEPDGRHLNAVGGLMGAVYYTLADFAFAVAENCVLDSDTVTVTQTAQINFLRPWNGGKVTQPISSRTEDRSASMRSKFSTRITMNSHL